MKYKFEGIGKFQATWQFALLASSPFAFLTNGFFGKIVFWFLVRFNMKAASKGLVLANVGISKLQVRAEEKEYNEIFDEAFKQINEKKGRLTDEEKKSIDDKVISAFERFAVFVKL